MSIPIELMDQNPWWKNPEEIFQDKRIVTLSKSTVCGVPRIKHTFELDTDAVYTLRGPRQVGKTTLLKDMIQKLIKDNVAARNIFYYTCDLIDNPKTLAETLSSYLETIRPDKKQRAYLFIDEISSVKDWQKAIKFLADKDSLTQTTLILTGSHTLDIKRASEKLPGRRGDTKDLLDKVMLPMKFSEYAETLSKDVNATMLQHHMRKWENRKAILTQLLEGEIPQEIKEFSFLSKELQKLFQSYILTGGIARVTDEYLKHGEISENIYKTYVDVVLGDLAKWGKRENYLRQVISRVVETFGSPISWNTLKQGTDIASHNTIAEYIDTLSDSFVVHHMFCYDANRNKPAYQKEKKLYFTDPFFLHAMRAWITGKKPFVSTLEYLEDPMKVGVLVEGVAADHMARLAFRLCEQKQLFCSENSVMYWRGKKGREVDFILKQSSSKPIAVELKYQSRITSRDFYGVIDFKKIVNSPNALILSKETLEVQNNVAIVPIWLFLLIV
ncbi:MAG: ATP-binding protein [Nitrososphaerota archaeon]|jgi:predicted AAA+ superfamily ATPase|nr:ATP-binding protein [Nitrososphaerota archaeon]